MSRFRLRLDTGFLTASFSRPQRTFIVAATVVATFVLAYADARLPTLNLAPLATLCVVIIQAVGGFAAGLASAGATAILFAAAERIALGGRFDSTFVFAVLGPLVTYLLVVLLLEFVRNQSAALNESRLRLQGLELVQAKA